MPIDLRTQLPPVRDQGTRPTCVAFAASAFNDHAPGGLHSAEFLAWCAVEASGAGDERAGVPLTAAADVMVRFGQPPELVWPYRPVAAGAPPVAVFRIARPLRRAARISALGFNPGVALAELTADRIVVLGLRITSAFYRVTAFRPTVDSDDLRRPAATFLHAVALVGRLRTAYPWVIRNSWGTGWGDSGHAYASEDFVREHVREMLTVEA
jgi:hypothetical protein